jgi:ABC-type multidrug transport system fused ATPase/permease subunit
LIDSPDEGVRFDKPAEVSQKFSALLRMKNVSFHYPTRPDVPVLRGINFEILEGQKLAIVGQSGSGKSTIAAIILRFFDPIDGEVFWGDKNALDWDKTELRSQMAFVPQEVILFGGTIRDNILYGNPNASQTEIDQVVIDANIQEFISNFPEGLDTLVGERGVQLSGGQRQRIAIARAMIRNPKVLILDEATSALDTQSEKQVQEALNRLMKGRTSVVIAHRLSTIKDCDQILVLEKGLIMEHGTHEELIAQPQGFYRKMLSMQNVLDENLNANGQKIA